MSSVTGSGDRFEPLHDAHAIEHVVVSIQFDRPLPDAAIVRLQEACVPLEDALPGKAEMRGVGFSIGPQGVNPIIQASSSVPDGFVRNRTAANGAIEKELRIDRSGVAFRNASYTRWINVWGEAKRYIEVALTAIGDDAQLANYSLNYSDKFIWQGEKNSCRPHLVLRQDSQYLSPNIFAASDLWHSHTGMFTRANSTTKRLLVVNSDCVDEPISGRISRVVRVTTVLTDMLNQPDFDQTAIATSGRLEFLDSRINELHNVLKAMFGEIVTPDMSSRIALGGPNAAQ